MKKISILLIILSLILVFCSKKKEPTELEVTTHPAGWLENHGQVLLDSSFSKAGCQSCHGEQFDGGASKVSCIDCHFYPHLPAWNNENVDDFHGKIARSQGNDVCQSCHGSNYNGGSSGVACSDCHTYPHSDLWLVKSSDSFHGKVVKSDSIQLCQVCHGTVFDGGTSGVSCYTCHTYPHLTGWNNPSSEGFHGTIAGNQGNEVCQSCHGSSFGGGSSGVACSDCHTYPHPDTWLDLSSQDFHGKVSQQQGREECQACHGDEFLGGSSGFSCFDCHTYPHAEFFKGGTIHGDFIKSNLNWELAECKACHGTDYTGGRVTVGLNCRDCHQSDEGPEACNTCHGDFYNSDQIAPPQNLQNQISTSAVGVGTHQKHVSETIVTTPYEDCSTCHIPVTRFDWPTHFDGSPLAEVVFNSLATDDQRLNTSWQHDIATCSEVYCHGGFKFDSLASNNQWAYVSSSITGKQDPVIWTQAGVSSNDCSFCHGLPPDGHINNNYTVNDCANCHGSVVNSNGRIIDKTKHINGQIDLN